MFMDVLFPNNRGRLSCVIEATKLARKEEDEPDRIEV